MANDITGNQHKSTPSEGSNKGENIQIGREEQLKIIKANFKVNSGSHGKGKLADIDSQGEVDSRTETVNMGERIREDDTGEETEVDKTRESPGGRDEEPSDHEDLEENGNTNTMNELAKEAGLSPKSLAKSQKKSRKNNL
ncbi:hypothetical protein HAX54_022350 [Datura stramonium]|uniref:Uncharacterized protein n=1 Tax=Datura stramonium TaxID=4076 RepID=A0ABS8S4M7_DATST|nr:hypothetical protein [Datura stramonium]